MTLLGTVPATVLAQEATGRLLLNEEATAMGTVTVEGQQYQVYRYENSLPYASGISVYRNGQQVTDEVQVQAVLGELARRRAADGLGQQEVETLRELRRAAMIIANESGRSAEVLANTTAYIDQLQTVQVDGSTAWEATTREAPSASALNVSATDLRPSLPRAERYAGWVASNATELITLIERRQNGTAVESQRLYDRYAATMTAVDRLAQEMNEVDGLTRVSTLAAAVSANASSVPERGEEIASRFGAIAERLRRADNRTTTAFDTVDRLTGFGSAFRTVEDAADDRRVDLMNAWASRRHAPRDIYGTLLGIPVVLGLGVGYVRRTG